MSENTKIEWAHHTFNPVVGCTKISAACDNCYAEGWAKRAGSPELWNGERRRTTPENWRKPIIWNERAKKLGIRYRVFCASLADVFDNQWEPQWRADLWALIADTPHLDWLLLTKRPQNIAKMLPSPPCETFAAEQEWPWPNVWLGTTVENQEEADRRIPQLLSIPAAVHFLSCEPLLGPLDVSKFMWPTCWHWDAKFNSPQAAIAAGAYAEKKPQALVGAGRNFVNWVISGGESGGNSRPSHPDWFRSLRDQCGAARVAYLHKQNGEFAPGEIAGDFLDPEKPAKGMSWTGTLDGWHETWSEPDGHIDDEPDVYRVGKKRAGRKLDGVEHNGYPQP